MPRHNFPFYFLFYFLTFHFHLNISLFTFHFYCSVAVSSSSIIIIIARDPPSLLLFSPPPLRRSSIIIFPARPSFSLIGHSSQPPFAHRILTLVVSLLIRFSYLPSFYPSSPLPRLSFTLAAPSPRKIRLNNLSL
ncbi:hypothetical protein ACJIZ3_006264 [Penstemon smallii]|uniref:Uncharacterized protein n=1 Tax=Penstemon smallii TaxID=265156 RepID=A0ABD3S795_9LAMI